MRSYYIILVGCLSWMVPLVVRADDTIQVPVFSGLLDRSDWRGALAHVRANCSSLRCRLDNGEARGFDQLEGCVEYLQRFFEDSSRCSGLQGSRRGECLKDARLTKNGHAIPEFTAEYCGFRYARYEDQAAAQESELLETDRAVELEAERAARLRRLEEEAMDQAGYKRAELAAQICENRENLGRLRELQAHAARVDRASGTVDLSLKRRFAEARLHWDDEYAELVKRFKGTGGQAPRNWCKFERPSAFVERYVARRAKEQDAPSRAQ